MTSAVLVRGGAGIVELCRILGFRIQLQDARLMVCSCKVVINLLVRNHILGCKNIIQVVTCRIITYINDVEAQSTFSKSLFSVNCHFTVKPSTE